MKTPASFPNPSSMTLCQKNEMKTRRYKQATGTTVITLLFGLGPLSFQLFIEESFLSFFIALVISTLIFIGMLRYWGELVINQEGFELKKKFIEPIKINWSDILELEKGISRHENYDLNLSLHGGGKFRFSPYAFKNSDEIIEVIFQSYEVYKQNKTT